MADKLCTCTTCGRTFKGHQRECRPCRQKREPKRPPQKRRSVATIKPPGTLAERFWPKVAKGRDDECWPWTAARTPKGYGQVREGGAGSARLQTHRVAYELAVGPIPEGLEVDHTCRNRACCNPAHLDPCTHAENLRRGRERAAQDAARRVLGMVA